MASGAVILILGGGPRIGASVARKFASQGWQVAIASRSLRNGSKSPEGYLQVKVNVLEPMTVPHAFETVRASLGAPPSVVVFNGGFRPTNDPQDPFSLPLEAIRAANTAGFESVYVAAQEALKGFTQLPSSTPKTFIFTGNVLNQAAIPQVFAFGLSKRLAAGLIEWGANAYGPKGYRFYYADERKSSDGRPAGVEVDGDAHGEMYWKLAQPGKQEHWLVTFTKDLGRRTYGAIDFDGTPYKPKY